jgi:hypothetical protein
MCVAKDVSDTQIGFQGKNTSGVHGRKSSHCLGDDCNEK